jgi:NTP pyrophosphatase (non-canonical NTP hydrolase)
MTKQQLQVLEFMLRAGQPAPVRPTITTPPNSMLRLELIEEEFDELETAVVQDDLVEIADALGDLLYVLLGTAVSYGIDLEPVFEEIHRSNLSKFIDGHVCGCTGKWLKGSSYDPPKLTPILNKQSTPPQP